MASPRSFLVGAAVDPLRTTRSSTRQIILEEPGAAPKELGCDSMEGPAPGVKRSKKTHVLAEAQTFFFDCCKAMAISKNWTRERCQKSLRLP